MRPAAIDLHTHSACSDGTDAVPALITAARTAGLDAIALADHDTMVGVADAQTLGAQAGIEVLRALEMSAHLDVAGGERPVHLLAYGCRPTDAPLDALLAATRAARVSRVPRMLGKLAGLGCPLELGEVEAQARRATSTGRPHIADALVARGYVASRDEAFALFLDEAGPAYVGRYTPTVAEALAAVGGAGGVAVIAHPWGRGNRTVLTPAVIAGLAEQGLYGVEAHHLDHAAPATRELVGLAHDLGLVVTGGSDYHGTGKTGHPLGVRRTDAASYEALTAEITTRKGQL
ncbi:MAG: PHP domain-containing protein [Propionibacteriaceae bacterium]|jgi:predicted metal-dependent phosphoesterase TrpH|nr:PHP domain-containing protein [Propionibacteriaceae bacterium]